VGSVEDALLVAGVTGEVMAEDAGELVDADAAVSEATISTMGFPASLTAAGVDVDVAAAVVAAETMGAATGLVPVPNCSGVAARADDRALSKLSPLRWDARFAMDSCRRS
jgi:hypothetical protein